MRLIFSSRGWNDHLHWQANDPKLRERVNSLIEECMRSPFKGRGKPEPLPENWTGWWARRINDEHRLVYRVSGGGDDRTLEIAQCRYHYR